jgi:hypothetical protein
MSSYQSIYSLRKNLAFTERQHRLLWMVTQAVALGLVLGLVSRLVWDHDIVASIVMGLRDFGVALWAMLQDLANACGDFIRFVSQQQSY